MLYNYRETSLLWPSWDSDSVASMVVSHRCYYIVSEQIKVALIMTRLLGFKDIATEVELTYKSISAVSDSSYI